ncbi:hypothetical protein [Roseicyclus elongatus]|nr:hypothetical protein [Roseibacterium elongatum]
MPRALCDRPALHLLTLAWGIATAEEAASLAAEIDAFAVRWPKARFLIFANTADEAVLCRAAGLAVIQFNQLNLVDETRFTPVDGVEKTVGCRLRRWAGSLQAP